jgi:3-methyl-2-oxobutanoate hydroxymethyltransferase
MDAVRGVISVAKVKVSDVLAMKGRGERITMVTAYDYPSALQADKSGIDMILVGDSLGMVVLGYENPIPVTVDDIIHHTRPVARGAKRPLIVGDMPFMSYHVSVEDAIRNAGRIIKEGGADTVKLEGGREVAPKVRALVDEGIPVQAHIGLMPQRASVTGRFNVQGTTAEAGMEIVRDAEALEEAGAFSVVLEFVTAEVAEMITGRLSIPTIGIGSGPSCDGQVLVLHDLLGVYKKAPPFAKRYADLRTIILEALSSYCEEVRSGKYPDPEHTVNMEERELSRLKDSLAEP